MTQLMELRNMSAAELTSSGCWRLTLSPGRIQSSLLQLDLASVLQMKKIFVVYTVNKNKLATSCVISYLFANFFVVSHSLER